MRHGEEAGGRFLRRALTGGICLSLFLALVPGIPVRGMYLGRQKNMLFCTVGRKQLHVLKRAVVELDSSAFLDILEAKVVLGKGFSERSEGGCEKKQKVHRIFASLFVHFVLK